MHHLIHHPWKLCAIWILLVFVVVAVLVVVDVGWWGRWILFCKDNVGWSGWWRLWLFWRCWWVDDVLLEYLARISIIWLPAVAVISVYCCCQIIFHGRRSLSLCCHLELVTAVLVFRRRQLSCGAWLRSFILWIVGYLSFLHHRPFLSRSFGLL